MQTTVTVTASIERGDGSKTTIVETYTEADEPRVYTERQNVRSVGETALGRVLDRVGGTDA